MGPTIECHDYLIVRATLPLGETLVAILRMAAYTRKNALHLLLLRIESDKRGNITKDSSSRMLRQTPTILYNSARISCFKVLVLMGKPKVLLEASR